MNTLEIFENLSAMIEYMNGINQHRQVQISFKKLKACVESIENYSKIMVEHHLSKHVSDFNDTYNSIYIQQVDSSANNVMENAREILQYIGEHIKLTRRSKLEIRLIKLYFRFHKWKCIVKAKNDPKYLQTVDTRFSFALSKQVIPTVPFSNHVKSSATIAFKRRKKLIMPNEQKYTNCWNGINIWSLFPRQCSAPEHNVGEEFSHKWKLVVLVDDLLNIAGNYRSKMAWVQRWLIRKLSKGNVSNHNSSASKLLSSYKVELSAADDDYQKEEVENTSNNTHFDYDTVIGEKSSLHVCIRTLCVTDSKVDSSDMTTSIAGAHSLMFLTFADRSNRFCEHDIERLKHFAIRQ